ncbi:MAG: hypothetical protein K5777_07935 [Nitrosopumilus sp.]|nr:hypothetical protein [Nitrosopumilus sp.]
MLSKRAIIGFAIGILILVGGGYSVIDKWINPTIIMNEDFFIEIGKSQSFTIPAPISAPQHMKIIGDAFDLKLQSPGDGLQIPNTSYKKELSLDWVHLKDGETKILIQNTGKSELEITSTTEQSHNPYGFTIDLMVITTGMVIIGFSMGFTLRKPKGF